MFMGVEYHNFSCIKKAKIEIVRAQFHLHVIKVITEVLITLVCKRIGINYNCLQIDRKHYVLDTFQNFLIAEHIEPCMHILEISISSLKHLIVRPTKTPKSADKKRQFLTFKVNFLCQKLSKSF